MPERKDNNFEAIETIKYVENAIPMEAWKILPSFDQVNQTAAVNEFAFTWNRHKSTTWKLKRVIFQGQKYLKVGKFVNII